ncbi:calcium-activated chloride channel regulator family member 3-like [Artemia franciscana]|uniref:calcium-activated chloride channel regulator family member 3-like n=1 Tax=Artemia franciscana TaxID=6661 RepID=UPI0032D9AEFE
MLWILIFCCFVSASLQVTLKDGYEDIIVAIESNVEEPLDCERFFREIETSFKVASSALYEVSSQKVYFEKVNVLIPSSWQCFQNSDSNEFSAKDAAFRLSKRETATVKQYGKCGEQGDYAIIPARIFSDNSGSQAGRIIFEEWLRFRYGVFDTASNGNTNYCSFSLERVCNEVNCTQKVSQQECDLPELLKTEHGTICRGLSPKDVIFKNRDLIER